MEVLDNDTTPGDKIPLIGSGMTKGKSGCASVTLKIGMVVEQHYTFSTTDPQDHRKT